MREIVIAISSGVFAGLFVYSVIGWIFTKKMTTVLKYKLICLFSIVCLIIIIMLAM
ncbi:MAG: hypothetical protein PHI44_01105 [Candidatus Ratteibacteria bacterium]|nr:hypothetical protein [Candidatus Ratteibacteria bacterium]